MKKFYLVSLAAVVFALPGCGEDHPSNGYTQKGMASWYGRDWDGRPTADGERFHMNQLTAAHRTLPFNTIVQVENLNNGRTVQVRINDRGPYTGGRIIDLSEAAAHELAVGGAGVVPVELEVIQLGDNRRVKEH